MTDNEILQLIVNKLDTMDKKIDSLDKDVKSIKLYNENVLDKKIDIALENLSGVMKDVSTLKNEVVLSELSNVFKKQ